MPTKPKEPFPKTCLECKKIFHTVRENKKFCSGKCRFNWFQRKKRADAGLLLDYFKILK